MAVKYGRGYLSCTMIMFLFEIEPGRIADLNVKTKYKGSNLRCPYFFQVIAFAKYVATEWEHD